MNTTIFLALICVGMIVVAAIVAIVLLLDKERKDKSKDAPSASTRPARQKNWKSWIPYIIAALILSFWTMYGALFFLLIVWIMRWDPKFHAWEIPYPTDLERDTVKGRYTWLFLSPIFTIPAMIASMGSLSYYASINERVLAVLIPCLFHIPLLFLLNAKSQFMYRHTQQAIYLVALRAGMASLAMSIGGLGGGAWLFLLGNGSLWLFGTIWGRNQAVRKECWLMNRKGETILAPESQISDDHAVNKELDELLQSMTLKDRQIAYEKSITAFRAGTPNVRKRALAVLSSLGEVEKF